MWSQESWFFYTMFHQQVFVIGVSDGFLIRTAPFLTVCKIRFSTLTISVIILLSTPFPTALKQANMPGGIFVILHCISDAEKQPRCDAQTSVLWAQNTLHNTFVACSEGRSCGRVCTSEIRSCSYSPFIVKQGMYQCVDISIYVCMCVYLDIYLDLSMCSHLNFQLPGVVPRLLLL